jgi:AAA domain-containing protein
MTATTLFKPAEVTSAFLKMGLLGFQGSGKTKTAARAAIGLVQYMKERGIPYADKPALFIDTETGSDWVIPDFRAAGLPLQTAKTRAFADLLIAVDEAETNGSILIIDSITHFWKEICETYMRQKKRNRLQFEDWNYLKGEWGKFTDRYVNSGVHIILCGRAGFEYDYNVDEDTGKKNLEKTGVKMKAEGEMGFEPSLLVYMERHQEMDGNKVKRVWRSATVLKDRSTLLDGREFEDPGFEAWLPHIDLLNLGGKQLGVDTSRTSAHMITVEKRDWQPVQREIVVDEIQTLLVLHIPGQAAADKQKKAALIRKHFNAAWTEIEKVMPLFDLRAGYDSLHQELEGKPSRYGLPAKIETEAETRRVVPIRDDIGDDLPDHSADPKRQSLKDRLLSDIPNLMSVHDCLHWGLEMSPHATQLNKRDMNEVKTALMARQSMFSNGHGTHQGISA